MRRTPALETKRRVWFRFESHTLTGSHREQGDVYVEIMLIYGTKVKGASESKIFIL